MAGELPHSISKNRGQSHLCGLKALDARYRARHSLTSNLGVIVRLQVNPALSVRTEEGPDTAFIKNQTKAWLNA